MPAIAKPRHPFSTPFVLAGLSLLLFLLTLAAYRQCPFSDFINLDDGLYVTDNPYVQQGLTVASIRWAITTSHAYNWHPLTWLSHMLDVQLYGMNPWGHHLTSILIHALNSVLLFWFLLCIVSRWSVPASGIRTEEVDDHRVSETTRPPAATLIPALTMAAIFAVHPLHVESVAWVSERKDVLCTLFWLLTLLAYGRYAAASAPWHHANSLRASNSHSTTSHSRRSGHANAPIDSTVGLKGVVGMPTTAWLRPTRRTGWYLLSLFSFILALMSKPMAVTLPFVLLLLDWWPLERLRLTSCPAPSDGAKTRKPKTSPGGSSLAASESRLPHGWILCEKLPFFALSLAACVVTFSIQHAGRIGPAELPPFTLRAANALLSYAKYIVLTLFPHDLAFFYPYPSTYPPAGQIMLAASLITAITVLALWFGTPWRTCRSSPISHRVFAPSLLVGWLWFLGTLVPVIGLVKIGGQAYADRYMYLPMIGLLIMTAWGLPAAWTSVRLGRTHQTAPAGKCDTTEGQPPLDQGVALPHSQILLLLALIPVCIYAVLTFRQTAYWRNCDTLFTHTLAVTQNNDLAHACLGAYLVQARNDDAGIWHLDEALRLNPHNPMAQHNLGTVLARRGDLTNSLAHFNEAVWLVPYYARSWLGLGRVHQRLGHAQESLAAALRAVALRPELLDARMLLAESLIQQGRLAEADQVAWIKPRIGGLHYNVGLMLQQAGHLDMAMKHYRAELDLNPTNALAWVNLGNVMRQSRQTEEALRCYRQALVADPILPQAHFNLGTLLLEQRQPALAQQHLQTAWQADPDTVQIPYELGFAFLAQHRPADAITVWQQALQRHPDATSIIQELAWVLATARHPAARNGPRAVSLATELLQRKGPTDLIAVDILAAAYAEAGQFTNAVALLDSALDAMPPQASTGDTQTSSSELSTQVHQRREQYRLGLPYRQ